MSTDGLLSLTHQESRPVLLSYGSAIVTVAAATLLRWLFDPLLDERLTYTLFYLAILVSSWYGGLMPGLIAVVLSGFTARYLFIEPRYSLAIDSLPDIFAWLVYLIVALVSVMITHTHRDTVAPVEAKVLATEKHLFRVQQEARERALKAISASKRDFQALADHAPVLIWQSDTAGRFTYVNKRWTEFTGYTFDEVQGRDWAEDIHPEDAERCLEAYNQAFRSREEFRFDCRLRRADGSFCWVMAHGVPRLTPDGVFEGYIGSILEIHDRKEMEMRNERLLRFTTALSKAVTPVEVAEVVVVQGLEVMGAHLGIVALLDEHGKFVRMINRRGVPDELVELFSVLPVEANAPLPDAVREGQPVWVRSPEEYREHYPTWASEVRPRTKTQAVAALPLRIGNRIIGGIELSFPQPVEFSPNERNFLITAASLCAQAMERARLFEAESDARQVAEQANNLKVRFLGMVSHELRAPLHLIMGFTDMLQLDDVDWDDEKRQDAYHILHQEADKLHNLVEQLLDASQLQAGTLSIHPEPRPLDGVIDMARPIMESLAQNHRLMLDIPGNLPLVRVDAMRMSQVLTNLVSNAAKYSPDGTTITVSAHRRVDNYVQIDVTDEGEGIPDEYRATVFQAFHRIQGDRAKKVKGVGLGLSIVKGLIEAHGGTIWIQNRSGPGTTFSLTLPMVEVSETDNAT
jgi:PAS domain S-box-containing protein